jgi:ATP-dependent Clp protease ATP-binding subunit ClpA
VFERFTERARQVIVLAQEEARGLGHSYIGTEHLLLGLVREEEGLAARVLERLDVTLERVRGQVVRIVGSGEEVPSGQIPFTPRAKKVMEMALRESLSLGHNYIGTEHLLLALVRENEGVAARILLDFDADAEKLRNEVIRMLSGPRGHVGREEDWQPGLQWEHASVRWTADGPELLVPLRLEARAAALLESSPAWTREPLMAIRHQLERGRLLITADALLEAVDPRALRRALDEAVKQADEDASAARSREAALGEAFLAALREAPPS